MSRRNLLTGRVLRSVSPLASALLALPAMASTILVPQAHPTIQAAINAALPGDVVIVAPGVYSGPGNRDLSLLGKAITLRSATGAAACIIDATDLTGAPHSVFVLQHFETSASVIDGFTITGGYAFNGGGIYVNNGSPTIRNCTITGNDVGCWGGGVYCENGSSPRLVNCAIVGNTSTDEGGGVFCISASPRIENCVIAGNTASVGAGACSFGGLPLFVNCRITGNNATSYGGGLYLWGGRVVNSTIANNSAATQSSGVYFGSGATIANSIIWGNSGSAPINAQTGVTYSIVQGGASGIGNRTADPLFVNAAAGDFRVRALSPAIDTGSNAQVPAGVLTDLAGSARFAGAGSPPNVDIGAYELRLFVKEPARAD